MIALFVFLLVLFSVCLSFVVFLGLFLSLLKFHLCLYLLHYCLTCFFCLLSSFISILFAFFLLCLFVRFIRFLVIYIGVKSWCDSGMQNDLAIGWISMCVSYNRQTGNLHALLPIFSLVLEACVPGQGPYQRTLRTSDAGRAWCLYGASSKGKGSFKL